MVLTGLIWLVNHILYEFTVGRSAVTAILRVSELTQSARVKALQKQPLPKKTCTLLDQFVAGIFTKDFPHGVKLARVAAGDALAFIIDKALKVPCTKYQIEFTPIAFDSIDDHHLPYCATQRSLGGSA